MKRYSIKVVWPPFNRQPEETEVADGEWMYAKDVDAAISARDARIAELERELSEVRFWLGERDKFIAASERHLAACKAECRAWRVGEISFDPSRDYSPVGRIDLCAATDAAGGVA